MHTRTHPRNHVWTILTAMILVAAVATTADAIIIVTPRPGQPPNPVRLTQQDIAVQLSDRAAAVSVELTYHNPSNLTLEGEWVFPLPPEAAVDKFSLFVDGEEIQAELLEANEARRTYESIVRRVRDPALLEYVGRQLLRARIFPINPRSDAKVKLYYTHPLTADFGTTDFVYPLGSERLDPDTKVTLTVEADTEAPLLSLNSPTHQITVDRKSAHRATVEAAPRWDNGIADFHLLSTFDARDVGAQFLTMTDTDGDSYFMAIIAPGAVDRDQIAAKDVVFCFDHSGSMAGEKLRQAQAALRFCLQKLNPDDRFGLLIFNDHVDRYARTLRQASADEIAKALEFVDEIDAHSGTFIAGALEQSMQLLEATKRPKYVVFLTDGRPTVGPRGPDAIRALVSDANDVQARLFAFGVGNDLNAALLNDLADDARGFATYVAEGEDVEVAVSGFFRKVSQPVLTDCRFVYDGDDVGLKQIYPDVLPDVFAGSEVVLVGRFDGSGSVTARLLGTQGGQKTNHTFETAFDPSVGRYPFIPKLWAARRIGYLLEDMRRHGETGEVKDEVIKLSQKYGIMTPYTAFLAAPEEVRMAQAPRPHSGVPAPGGNASTGGGPGATAGVPSRRLEPLYLSSPPVAQEDKSKDSDAASTTRRQDLLSMDQATTERDVTAERIKTMPVLSDLEDLMKHSRNGGRIVSAGGKQFSLYDDVWVDWALFEGERPTRVIAIRPYSEAYFKLSQIKGIAPILTVGDSVYFRWGTVEIRIVTTGEESWNSDWDGLL